MGYNRSVVLRTSDWKFIPSSKGAPIVPWGTGIETSFASQPQLHDLRQDSLEQHNCTTEHPDIAQKMQQLLDHVLQAPYHSAQ